MVPKLWKGSCPVLRIGADHNPTCRRCASLSTDNVSAIAGVPASFRSLGAAFALAARRYKLSDGLIKQLPVVHTPEVGLIDFVTSLDAQKSEAFGRDAGCGEC